MYRFATFLFLVAWAVVVAGCGDAGSSDASVEIEIPEPIERDLTAIAERDTLVVLTQFNSTSYFLYRGEPMGYEFDYLQAFAKANDMHLKAVVVQNRDSLFVLLNEGVGDVVAARLTPTARDSSIVRLTAPLYTTEPVLVQRDGPIESADVPEEVDSLLDSAASAPPEPRRRDTLHLSARRIKNPLALAGNEVHVLDQTRFEQRLLEISDQATGDIYVVEVDSGTAEMLIQNVAEEDINFTVGHENVAELQESHYSNLAISPTLDRPYAVSWAVRSNAPELQGALDAWIQDNPRMRENLYQRYFVDRQGYQERVTDEYLASETGTLSPYDDLFREHAPTLGWDWRLLASQAFQESRFKPSAKSWAGAMGLLQLMPGTARQVGTSDPYDPADNVAGAVRYLEYLYDFWDNISDEHERLKFILASYNAGPGHVQDARALTEKHGGNFDNWNDVAFWLLRLSEAEIYRDPVVKYGFCRGLEPVTYVGRILDRYNHYQQFVDPQENESVAAAQ